MATWTFSGYNNGRGAAVTFTYTAAYDPATNKTRVTITNYTSVFDTGGGTGYCQLTGKLTVKATDNPGSYGTLSVEHHKGDAYYPTISSDVSQVIEVSHGTGTSKKITLSFNGTILSVTYSTSLNDDSTNTTVTVASATARTLSITAGTGSSITVTRQSSPWAATGKLTGGTVYDGDVLEISFAALTGYALTAQKVNGADFESGKTLKVSANVTVTASAVLKVYTLTIDADGHAAVTVTRGGVALDSGDTISHFDVLAVRVSARAGYEVSAADINGTAISPETEVSHTVSGPVAITVTTEAMPGVLLDVGGVRKRFLILIDSGGERKNYRAIFK